MSRQIFLGEFVKILKSMGFVYTRNTLNKYEDEGKIPFKFHRTPSGRRYIFDFEVRDYIKALDRK